MTKITELGYDILYHLTNYLSCKDFCNLTQCNRSFYQLQWIDCIWKQYCLEDFHIQYNYPNQSYRQFYLDCRQQHKRLPCPHLQSIPLVDDQFTWNQESKCQKCFVTGIENLFICLSPQCHQIVCDRHARYHARRSYLHHHEHAVFYKPNMSELFCQVCLDWVGGTDTHQAEQYHSSLITTHWLKHVYPSLCMQSLILEFKALRQIERQVRWKDTPQHIMKNKVGFCFISSTWMAEWEMFIEGWLTEPPIHVPIDQVALMSRISSMNAENINLFYLTATDNIMIISNDTWDYVSKAYTVIGNQITEEDIKPGMSYQAISKRIEFWKRRASAEF